MVAISEFALLHRRATWGADCGPPNEQPLGTGAAQGHEGFKVLFLM